MVNYCTFQDAVSWAPYSNLSQQYLVGHAIEKYSHKPFSLDKQCKPLKAGPGMLGRKQKPGCLYEEMRYLSTS